MVTKHGTIPCVRYGFLLVFYNIFVPERRTVYEIFDFKYAVTLKSGLGFRRGYWTCHHSIERMGLPMMSVLTVVLSRVVSEIFNVEKCRDL